MATLVALAGLLAGAGPANAAKGVARVTLVHGIKGLVADVALDHKVVLSGFKFQHVTGALPIPAGKHRIQIFKAGTKTNPQLDVTVTLKAGQDLTAVAALGAGDKPQAFVFDNHLSGTFSGPRALVLRNAAAAGKVALHVGGKTEPAVAGGEQGAFRVSAGSHRLRVTNASGETVDSSFRASVPAGRMLSVFVVGGSHAGNLFVVTAQQRPAGATVHSVGTGGTPPASGPALGIAALVLLAAGVGVSAAAFARRSRAPAH
jgi:hypothetical protein